MRDVRPESERDGDACGRGEDAVAWLQDELDPAARRLMSGHLDECGACRALVEEAAAILGALGAERAVARLAPMLRLKVIATAAAALLVVLVWQSGGRRPPDRGRVATGGEGTDSPALTWVASHLGADGTWSMSARSGSRTTELGMHAFGLLALVRGAGADASSELRESVAEAAHWLVDRQEADGSIGQPLETGRFDHPVAALALVEAAQLTRDPALRVAAEKAVGHITDQGVRLWRRGSQRGHAAWTMAALVRADQLGFRVVQSSLDRGRSSLGPAVAETLSGDFLGHPPFWELALGGSQPPRGEVTNDLFSASLAVLAPGLR